MIKWEQMVLLGNLEHGCELQPIDFAGFARVCGGTGFTIENPAEYGGILNQAPSTPGPVTIEAVVDPFEPQVPPKMTLGQASKFALSLTRAWEAEPGTNRLHGTCGYSS